MGPLGINKSFHVVLNNLTLTDAECLTDQKEKCSASFSISHYSFYSQHPDGHKTFNKHVFKGAFFSLMILIFFLIFFSWCSTDCTGLNKEGINTFGHSFSYHPLSLQSWPVHPAFLFHEDHHTGWQKVHKILL